MKPQYKIVIFCWLAMGILSMCANMTGALLPAIISGFQLTLGEAGMLPFAYFAAYALMSVPAGLLNERFGVKRSLSVVFLLACAASLMLSWLPSFALALAVQFVFGLCMAVVEVSVFPMLRKAGGAKNFAFNSVVLALLFGIVSALTPQLYSVITTRLAANDQGAFIVFIDWLTDDKLLWSAMYWLLALAFAFGAVYLSFLKIARKQQEEQVVTVRTALALFKNKTVVMFFFGTFCYVGLEQSCVAWMSKFFQIYHGLDPQTEGARCVSLFWTFLCIGCLPGLLLTRLFAIKKVFLGYMSLAVVAFSLGLFADKAVAVYAFPFTGFCLSIMWSAVFAQALNSVEEHHEAVSGILCAGVSGGAVFPYIAGALGDVIGLRGGLCVAYLCMAYLTFLFIKTKQTR